MRLSRVPGLGLLRGHGSHAAFDFGWYGAVYEQARWIVRAYYLVMLYWLSTVIAGHWATWREVEAIQPLWPLFWLRADGIRLFIDSLTWVSLVCMTGALLWPQRRVLRAGVFVCFLLWYAFINSFGKIGHDGHMWLAAGFLFIWLPYGDGVRRSVGKQHYYLAIFAGAQVILMLAYSMSGGWKVATGISQMVQGQVGTFHPYALANLTAFRLLQTNTESLLGPAFLTVPLVGWPMHLGAVYLETFALVAAFRPSLHRVWGAGLILFHFGTWLLMGINFHTNIALLGLLMVMSPFYRTGTPVWVTLHDLPLFGYLVRARASAVAAPQPDQARI